MIYQPTVNENTTVKTHDVVAELVFKHPDYRRILDIPSGKGAFASRCVARGREVVAADCRDICEVPGAQTTLADMNHRLPIEDDAFDVVVCIDGIEHLERPFDFVRECRRVVRNGGALVLSTPNISSLRSRFRWLMTGFHNKCKTPLDETNVSPRHHINMISFPEMRYLLHSNGFAIQEISTNRCKLASLAYGVLLPAANLTTRFVLSREEKEARQRRRNQDVQRQMFRKEILFGETMIVMARNDKA